MGILSIPSVLSPAQLFIRGSVILSVANASRLLTVCEGRTRQIANHLDPFRRLKKIKRLDKIEDGVNIVQQLRTNAEIQHDFSIGQTLCFNAPLNESTRALWARFEG